MPSADQVPVKSSHLTMLWPMWVVLIAGSTGSALRAVRPPNLHITPDARCDLRSCRERGRFLVALALGHHCPSHTRDFVGERDRSHLGRSPGQQRGEPRPVLGAMDLGITDHCERTGSKQAAQVSITALGDAAELFLAAARVLLRHEPNPG